MTIKKVLLYSMLVFMFVLSACGVEYKTYKGEGEHWSAEMEFMTTSNYESSDITLIYNGENPKSVGKFEYDFDYVIGKSGGSGAELNDGGVFQTSGGASNGASIMEHHEIKVTINWNERTETFILKHH